MRIAERFSAVAFDLDGTLIDTVPDLGSAANAMIALLGGRALPPERFSAFVGAGVEKFVERSLVECRGGVPPRAALRMVAEALFEQLYAQRLFAQSRVYDGVREGLQRLRDANIAMCCVTNKPAKFAVPLLQAAALAPELEFTLCAGSADERKPRPHMLLAAAARLGISPTDLLYIGDSVTDIQAGHAAGCQVIVVDYGYHHGLPLAASRPRRIISSLLELVPAGALTG